MDIKCVEDFFKNSPALRRVLADLGGLDDINADSVSKAVYQAKDRLTLKKKQAVMNAIALTRKRDIMKKSPVSEFESITSMLTASLRVGKKSFGGISLEDSAYALRLRLEAKLAGLMGKYGPKKLGAAISPGAREDLIRYLHGGAKNVNDPDVAGHGDAWLEVIETLRERFNAAGGGIKKLDDFVMPNYSVSFKVGKYGKQDWVQKVKPMLDIPRIVKQLNMDEGNAKSVDIAIGIIYDNIVYGGRKSYTQDMVEYKLFKAIGNRHQESRILHIKSDGGESYIKYQHEFGNGEFYSHMMSYLDMMSKEITAMEIFGPDADKVFNTLMLDARAVHPNGPGRGRDPQNVYDELMGRTVGDANKLAGTFQVLRNLGYVRKLGFATVSAITDIAFTGITSSFNGMGALKPFKRMFKSLATPISAKDSKLALKLGLMSDFVMDRSMIAHRFGESIGHGLSAKFADFTMRASGLNHWTISAKTSFSLEFLSTISEHTAKDWSALPPRLRNAFGRYGIDEVDWKTLRKSKKITERKVDFIDPGQLDEGLSRKVVGMIHAETRYAVPEPNARVRALIRQGTKGGTVSGEFMRSFGQLKTFPISVLASHWARGANMQGASRVFYLGSLLAGTTILGMLAHQAKEALRGKDFKGLTPTLVLRGVEQGGFFGLVGDVVSSSIHQGGLAGMISGSVFQDADEVATLLFGTAMDIATLEKKMLKRAAGRGATWVKGYAPGNLWYTHIVIERGWNAFVDSNLDFNFRSTQRKKRRAMKKKTGQEYWWRPGKTKPDRAPSISPSKLF